MAVILTKYEILLLLDEYTRLTCTPYVRIDINNSIVIFIQTHLWISLPTHIPT